MLPTYLGWFGRKVWGGVRMERQREKGVYVFMSLTVLSSDKG